MLKFSKFICLSLIILFASPCFAQKKGKKNKNKNAPTPVYRAVIPDPIDKTSSEMNYKYQLDKLLYISDFYVKLCDSDLFEKPLDESIEKIHYAELGVKKSPGSANLFPFPSPKQSSVYFETFESEPNCIQHMIVRYTQIEGAKNVLQSVVAETTKIHDKNGNEIPMDNGLKRSINALYYVLVAAEKEIAKAKDAESSD